MSRPASLRDATSLRSATASPPISTLLSNQQCKEGEEISGTMAPSAARHHLLRVPVVDPEAAPTGSGNRVRRSPKRRSYRAETRRTDVRNRWRRAVRRAPKTVVAALHQHTRSAAALLTEAQAEYQLLADLLQRETAKAIVTANRRERCAQCGERRTRCICVAEATNPRRCKWCDLRRGECKCVSASQTPNSTQRATQPEEPGPAQPRATGEVANTKATKSHTKTPRSHTTPHSNNNTLCAVTQSV